MSELYMERTPYEDFEMLNEAIWKSFTKGKKKKIEKQKGKTLRKIFYRVSLFVFLFLFQKQKRLSKKRRQLIDLSFWNRKNCQIGKRKK